jgi:phosphate starvation-inducible protein PhoH and related proteins
MRTWRLHIQGVNVSTKARQTRRKTEQAAEKSHSSRPKNPIQALVPNLLEQFDILFLIGPAGTGKTWSAMSAVWNRIASGKCDRVLISRPTVACDDEEIGYLPGDANEKMAPWMLPYQDVLVNVVGDVKTAVSVMKTFETLPLGLVRGRNFLEGTIAVGDEFQNASLSKLHAFLTRGCLGSKTIICGDPGQCDLQGGSPLMDVARECEAEGAAAVVEFSEDLIVRSPTIAKVNRAFARVRNRAG